ncbi:hypothetical protein F1C58_00890 [Glaciihabitans sp. INWT7]|uniref:hypothetical protein n=1 Tax=Glaciihabitans sp. INWT7 TaxID=2596912 RepID=UPI0016277331|nr:hypothetical protein [Glaciihabitans sp. INWT7]QNE45620.1 hypothetical protein F1C58_00890 [Glaciihabitans sp. INWT7]
MESESPSIDPRYRPEFQRGYRGSAASIPAASMPVVDDSAKVGMPPAATVAVESVVESVIAVDPRLVEPEVAEPEQTERRRNPYALVIPVVALGFVILGTWLLVSQFVWSYSGAFGSDNSVERRFSGVLSYVFAAPLVTVGLGSLVGYGFWLAVRRRQRP